MEETSVKIIAGSVFGAGGLLGSIKWFRSRLEKIDAQKAQKYKDKEIAVRDAARKDITDIKVDTTAIRRISEDDHDVLKSGGLLDLNLKQMERKIDTILLELAKISSKL